MTNRVLQPAALPYLAKEPRTAIQWHRTFSVCQLPSGECESTDREPSDDAAATTRPSSYGAKATLLTDDV